MKGPLAAQASLTLVVVFLTAGCGESTSVPSDSQSAELFGKGRPWFRADPPATFAYPADDAAYKIRSDRRDQFLSDDGTGYLYQDGVCGVTAQIFSPDDGNGSGDAVMDPDGASIKGRDRSTCGDPRAIIVTYDTPADDDPAPSNPVETFGTFHNMNKLWQVPIGDEVEGEAGFNTPRCSILRFKPSQYDGSDHVLIFRESETTWHIRTKEFPDTKAWCGNEGRFYHLPFALTVVMHQ